MSGLRRSLAGLGWSGWLGAGSSASSSAPRSSRRSSRPTIRSRSRSRTGSRRPTPPHWLGTDQGGRDVLSRILYGGPRLALGRDRGRADRSADRVSGGLLAAYRGGLAEQIVMRIVDGVASIPLLVWAIAIVGILGVGPSPWVRSSCRTRSRSSGSSAACSRRSSHASPSRWRSASRRPISCGRATSRAPRIGDRDERRAAELPLADHRAEHAPRRHRHRHRGLDQLRGPRRPAAAAELGHDAVGRAQRDLFGRMVAAGLPGPRHLAHRRRVQSPRRRVRELFDPRAEAGLSSHDRAPPPGRGSARRLPGGGRRRHRGGAGHRPPGRAGEAVGIVGNRARARASACSPSCASSPAAPASRAGASSTTARISRPLPNPGCAPARPGDRHGIPGPAELAQPGPDRRAADRRRRARPSRRLGPRARRIAATSLERSGSTRPNAASPPIRTNSPAACASAR